MPKTPTAPNPRPYVLLYRNVVTGHKGRRTFRTRNEMSRFIWECPDEYAITYVN